MKLKIENLSNVKKINVLYKDNDLEKNIISEEIKLFNEKTKDEKIPLFKQNSFNTKSKNYNGKLSLIEKLPNFTSNFNVKNLCKTKQITQDEQTRITPTYKKNYFQENELKGISYKRDNETCLVDRKYNNVVKYPCLLKRCSENKQINDSKIQKDKIIFPKLEMIKPPFEKNKTFNKSQKIISKRMLASELKSISNYEEIKDFYKYTENCIKSRKMLTSPTENEIKEIQNTVKFKDDILCKKLAVFDLDETLIHSEASNQSDCDCVLEVMFPNMGLANLGVNIRPNILSTLKSIKNHYMLIVYTASHQAYADTILDYLDPNKSLFSYRLYRNNCFKIKLGDETVYVKDLRIFKGVDLKNIVIIDNSVLSFAFQLENGIPILPFYNNKSDNEMKVLEDYLISISKKEDLRVENSKYIKLQIFRKMTNESYSSTSEKDTNSLSNQSYETEEDNHIVKLISCSFQQVIKKKDIFEKSPLEKRNVYSIKTK